MANDRASDTQLALAEQLQELLLQDFLALAKKSELSPTDRRTLYQILKDGGWTLDPTRIPQNLRDKITSSVSPTEDLDEDPV